MSGKNQHYVVVTRDWALLCPPEVDSFEKAEPHLRKVAGDQEDFLICSYDLYLRIRNDLLSVANVTRSYDLSDVWFGIAGMDQWVELAGFTDTLIGNAYAWAQARLEAKGLEPHWVMNLQEALGVFSREPALTLPGSAFSMKG